MARSLFGLPPFEDPERPRACVAGLGNPGEEYLETRHNIGFRVIEHLARDFKARAPVPRFNHSLSEAVVAGASVHLIRPWTFMNLSGVAVQLSLDIDELDAARLIVVCDDIALPLGALRLRRGGSSGGQRGLEHIIETLGTDRFTRLRCGIGPVPDGVDAADFVLSPFLPGEIQTAQALVSLAAETLRYALLEGPDAAMNRYNGRMAGVPASESPL